MANIKKLTLLHTNDMHGDFLPKTVDGKETGGLPRLSGYAPPASAVCIHLPAFRLCAAGLRYLFFKTQKHRQSSSRPRTWLTESCSSPE